MNHLRELLEALPYKVGVDDCWASPQELKAAVDDAKRLGEQAVCFAIGDIDQAVALGVIPELCKLPYQTCWFEAVFDADDDSRRLLVGMLCSEEGGGFNAAVFMREPVSGWSLQGAVSAEDFQTNLMEMRCNAFEETRRGIYTMTYGVKAFISALHCSNVRQQEHAPSAKLQKARAKRGKAPLFSYWTLQLEGRSERGQDHGGTHASPRVHLRRGHPRQYQPGKWTWVQAHAVGNRSAGMVHKDYSSGPALLAAAR